MIMSILFTRTLSIIQFVSLAAISAFHRQRSVCAHWYKITPVQLQTTNNIHFTVFIRLRNRFSSAWRGAMTLLYGHQFNKLALYHHVKMCLFQTNWKQGTVHRISLHPQLSTLVYREYVVRREQQGEVRRELHFQFFTQIQWFKETLCLSRKKESKHLNLYFLWMMNLLPWLCAQQCLAVSCRILWQLSFLQGLFSLQVFCKFPNSKLENNVCL